MRKLIAGNWKMNGALAANRAVIAAEYALLSDGRYADANEWHEREWKGAVLPPFVNGLKDLREWFAEQERRDSCENEEGENDE